AANAGEASSRAARTSGVARIFMRARGLPRVTRRARRALPGGGFFVLFAQDGGGAFEGLVEVGADVFAADAVDEAGLHHDFKGLVARAAEDDGAAGFLHALDHAFEGVERGGVHGG